MSARSLRGVGRALPATIAVAIIVTVSACASDSTEQPPTTQTVSSTPVDGGPGLPGVEPGTNLEPMMEEPAQNDDTEQDPSQSDPPADN